MYRGRDRMASMVIGLGMLFLGLVAAAMMQRTVETVEGAVSGQPRTAPTDQQTPSTDQAASSAEGVPDIPWGFLAIAALALTLLAVLVAVVYVVIRHSRRRARRLTQLQRRLEQAEARHDRVLDEQGVYDVDILALLSRPALGDLTEAATAASVAAAGEAAMLRSRCGGRTPDEERLNAYERAVTAAAFAWRRAVQNADQRRLDGLTDCKQLLDTADERDGLRAHVETLRWELPESEEAGQ